MKQLNLDNELRTLDLAMGLIPVHKETEGVRALLLSCRALFEKINHGEPSDDNRLLAQMAMHLMKSAVNEMNKIEARHLASSMLETVDEQKQITMH